ncbi:hypothetical protein YPPY06_1902, partial [Yersinia pestis PY-06]
MAGFLP